MASVLEESELSELAAASRVAPNVRSIDDSYLHQGSRNLTNPVDDAVFKLQKMPKFETDKSFVGCAVILSAYMGIVAKNIE